MDEPALHIDEASWGARRPGLRRRVSGATTLACTLAAGAFFGPEHARFQPGTYSPVNPLAGPGALCAVIAFFAALYYVGASFIDERDLPLGTVNRGVVTVERGVLTLGAASGTSTVPLGDIEAGWEDETGRALLRLRDGRELTVDARSSGQVSALLDAVGMDHRRARLPIGSVLASVPGGRALGFLVLLFATVVGLSYVSGLAAVVVSVLRGLMPAASLLTAAGSCAASLAAVGAVLRVSAPRRAVVGADGVAIEGLWGRRFLPFREIKSAVATKSGVVLIKESGLLRRVLLPKAPGGEGLEARITAALAKLGDGVVDLQLERLDRRERTLESWIADLRTLTNSATAGYRSGALAPDRLATVVEDAAAPPERRIAAALAVNASGDVEARGRVRIAVDGTADETMRAALERAAEGEIDETVLRRASRARS